APDRPTVLSGRPKAAAIAGAGAGRAERPVSAAIAGASRLAEPAPVAGAPAVPNGVSMRRRPAARVTNDAAPPAPPRRSTRAEDVLGGARAGGDNGASRGWSKTAPAAAAARIPAPRRPVNAGTSGAGLPIRVPMAQLPGEDTVAVVVPAPTPAPVVAAAAVPVNGAEPDPVHVGSLLSKF